MTWGEWLRKRDMASLRLGDRFLAMEWRPRDEDKLAAWQLYVELLTRTAARPPDKDFSDEKADLESINSIIEITRQILRPLSRDSMEFAKIAILALNQVVRPFTAKWNRRSVEGAFAGSDSRRSFGEELSALTATLRKIARMLADMAGVDDLTALESASLKPVA
ncbi:MAG: hypothetical protein IPM03_00895 [Sulfuritalea sp.]|nr:hypothetical protein [Sulfuritalea sp.]